jgi:nitrate/TMAO reductase-like tetraheme cytochrome c subunit
MMKNDKIIVALGVVMLILASIGIYYWVPEKAELQSVNANEFIH